MKEPGGRLGEFLEAATMLLIVLMIPLVTWLPTRTAAAESAASPWSVVSTDGINEAGSIAAAENTASEENVTAALVQETVTTEQGAVLYSQPLAVSAPDRIPAFTGEDSVILNGNRPGFTEYEKITISGENYSPLDGKGRCGNALAMLHRSMMPKEERGPIGMIRPSGWQTVKYPGLVEGNYLYNRCHLIAYRLTGQNANECNLITGTRHMNTKGMLPYETEVMRYLENTGKHVLYRVTPYFAGDELVARGVEMEALSIEDDGRGISYHVFVYNHQPGIVINYRNGDSRIE